ncbi:MAG: hypothetical protein IPI32_02295 [Austwickia sp.]|nr:hypothetical protein [Austwickia sp.]MBK8437787.1 hypothetical protein [Austwickia sp.]MBK9100095.1 hypothetical protein [Austwickia sp.]
MAARVRPGGSSPFATFARRDILFDGVALILLISSALTPWNAYGGIERQPELVIALVSAALGLTLPYLVPAAATVDRSSRLALAATRVLTAMPLIIGTTVIFLTALTQSAATGMGVAFASGGAVMVAVPRADIPGRRLADAILRGLGAAALLAAGALSLADVGFVVSAAWDNPILWAASMPGVDIALCAWWLAALVLLRDPRAPATIGLFALSWPVAAAILAGLDALGASVLPAGSLLAFNTSGMALITAIAIGAILLHAPAALPPAPRAQVTGTAVPHWLDIAAALHVLITLTAVCEALRLLILVTWNSVGMIVGTNLLAGGLIGSTVCVVLTLASRILLLRAPVAGRLFTVAGGTLMMVGLLAAALADLVSVGNVQAVALVALPLLALACLLLPPSVRRDLGPLLPRDGWQGLGLTHEPEYAGAPRVLPLAVPVALGADQLFADLDGPAERP